MDSSDVILLIPGETSAPISSRMASSDESRKTEIAKAWVFPSPRKPLKTPKNPDGEGLYQRKQVPSSAYCKPKSRFVEKMVLVPSSNDDDLTIAKDSSFRGSPLNKVHSKLRKNPSAFEEKVEDVEIYRREELTIGVKKWRKPKVRVLLEWGILLLSMGCLIASLTERKLQDFVIFGLEIWKWCLMVSVTCCGRLVTLWLMTVLVFVIEKNFLLRTKVLYFVYGLRNSVRVCIWLSLILLSWFLLFDQGVQRSAKTEKVLFYVSRALVSLLIGSVNWLVKTILVKILASSFHMNKFFDRIREAFFNQYVLKMLSGPPENELAEKIGKTKSTGQLSFRSGGKGKGRMDEEVIDVTNLHKISQDKVSDSVMKRLIDLISDSGLSTISNIIDETFEEADQKDTQINSEHEAYIVAQMVFKNVAKPGYKYIEEEDLLRFFNKDEVHDVLLLFEGAAGTGKIKRSALKKWVVKAYLDRKSLAHSLNDSRTAVKQLHKLATGIVIVVNIVITLLLMGFATTKVLVVLSSQVVMVVFMFGNTCKMAFEAIIFVFVIHPFDVGDRCLVDGVQMIVEEMNILTTVFLKYNNEKIYYPNSVLATKPISNFYRSPDMSDSVEFSINMATPVDCIGNLKERITMYLKSKPNHWHENHSLVVKDIVDLNKLNMALYVQHTMNFQNISDRNIRRSDLVLELKRIFEDLCIRYNLLPQDVHLSYKGTIPPPIPYSPTSSNSQ
ncbi:putative mechanosensitive ion channel MscS, LSM domain superfamily [Dioscorea sansibarensis]